MQANLFGNFKTGSSEHAMFNNFYKNPMNQIIAKKLRCTYPRKESLVKFKINKSCEVIVTHVVL